ncbi:ankyrin [Colletotrichum sublineola]|nr:ankyrin [Colletotrichum sublineola]
MGEQDYIYTGKTALHSALLGGNPDNAIILLEAGAELIGGELAIAITSQQDKVVDKLLAEGSSFTEPSNISGTPSVLEAAVLTEDTDLISRVIKHSSQAVVASSLWAAIFVAKSTSNLSIFKTSAGSNFSYLMLASGLRPEKCLIAPINLGDDFPTSHIGWGCFQVPDDYVRWRREISILHAENYTRHDLLETALGLFNDRGVGFLILLRQDGYHRIIQCPSFGKCLSLEDLQTLQSFGVEMTWRILSTSIRDRCYDVTEWLLASGVDVNVAIEDLGNEEIYTPVQEAARQANLPLVEELMKHGANINAPASYDGATALQIASIGGYFGLVRRLLELQADPNALGGKWRGRTALEGSAEHGRLDVVQLLLNSGVETVGSGRGRRGYVRAIRFAQKEGHHAVARLIKSYRPWEEADQRLYDDKNLLHDDTEVSDDGIGGETEDEYGSSEANSEASGVPCEVSRENFEVDDENGDPSTDFGEDEDFQEYHSMVPDDTKEGPAYGIDERVDRPGDIIWREIHKTFSSDLPWLSMWKEE